MLMVMISNLSDDEDYFIIGVYDENSTVCLVGNCY